MHSQSAMNQNAAARRTLLETGIPMVKRIAPVQNVALGQSVKIPLLRMGILTGVLLQFTVPMNLVPGFVPSHLSPYSLVQQIKYTDFAGVDRTRTTGLQLWQALSMKAEHPLSWVGTIDDGGAGGNNPYLDYDSHIAFVPAFVNGAQTAYFSLYIPLAYNPSSDLTGAVHSQTNVGEHYVTVNLANSLVNVDPWAAPYISGDVSLQAQGITIEAFQHFIQPQTLTANALPLLDLSTIYGFEGGFPTSEGIAPNKSTFINFPNNRSILSTLINYENGSAFTLNGTDIAQITVLANSNVGIREMTPRYIREMMRQLLRADLQRGSYYIPSRRQPILTSLYANVQAQIDVLTVNPGVTQFYSQFEVQYPSGSPLPGIVV